MVGGHAFDLAGSQILDGDAGGPRSVEIDLADALAVAIVDAEPLRLSGLRQRWGPMIGIQV